LLAVLVLAGCSGDTDPATNVTETSATLHAHAHVDPADNPVSYWWQVATTPGAIGSANISGPTSRCATGPANVPAPRDYSGLSCNLSNLAPNTTFYFKFCGDGANQNPACTSTKQFTTLGGGTLIKEDPMTNADPVPLWRSIECGRFFGNSDPSRVQTFSSGGPSGGPYRRLTVLAGDDWSGNRCELGKNDWSNTFQTFQQGQHRYVEYWLRLPTALGFQANGDKFQQVSQLKQAEPYCTPSPDAVAIEIQVRENQLFYNAMYHSPDLWATSATPLLNRWVRIRHDIVFSTDPSVGQMQLTISDEQGQIIARSPVLHTRTLVTEAGSGCGLPTGSPVPDHLRIGIYHDPSYGTTSVEYGDVRVYAP
jgi:hypothetical protein